MSSRVLIASWLNLDEDPDEPLPSGWIEPLVPMRKRVLRNGSTTWPAIELPDIDMLESLADHEARRPGDDCAAIDDEGQQAERERRSGAGAIAWAVAYRDGLEQGR